MNACRHKYQIESSGAGLCAECYMHGAASRDAEVEEQIRLRCEAARSAIATQDEYEATHARMVTAKIRANAAEVKLREALADLASHLNNGAGSALLQERARADAAEAQGYARAVREVCAFLRNAGRALEHADDAAEAIERGEHAADLHPLRRNEGESGGDASDGMQTEGGER